MDYETRRALRPAPIMIPLSSTFTKGDWDLINLISSCVGETLLNNSGKNETIRTEIQAMLPVPQNGRYNYRKVLKALPKIQEVLQEALEIPVVFVNDEMDLHEQWLPAWGDLERFLVGAIDINEFISRLEAIALDMVVVA